MPSRLDKQHIRRAFSRRLPSDNLSLIPAQRLWQRLQMMSLSPALVVDVGGDGVFVAHCYERAQIVAIDIALPVLLSSIRHEPSRWLITADAEALPLADESVDLVWSNLCLEWTEGGHFLAAMGRVLKPGGLLAFTSLGPGTLSEMRSVFSDEERVHDFADMHTIGDQLLASGFAEPLVESERLTLTYACSADALSDARNRGASCALTTRARGLLGRQHWQRILTDYTARYADSDGRVSASYEVLYVTAWKRQATAAEIPIHFY